MGGARWRAVERERPDVIVLDIVMQKMTGFDVLHRIRALTDKPPVIVLSARGREQDVTRAFDLGPMITGRSRSARRSRGPGSDAC